MYQIKVGYFSPIFFYQRCVTRINIEYLSDSSFFLESETDGTALRTVITETVTYAFFLEYVDFC